MTDDIAARLVKIRRWLSDKSTAPKSPVSLLGDAIFLNDRLVAAEAEIARLTAPVSESYLEMAAECRKEGRRIYNREHAKRSLIDCENEAIAHAIAQARRQGELRATENNALANKHACIEGRRQMREEAAAKARLYAHSPCSGDSNNTQEAFDQGMNHLAGAIDSAIAIEAAIRALPLDPPGEEASGG